MKDFFSLSLSLSLALCVLLIEYEIFVIKKFLVKRASNINETPR